MPLPLLVGLGIVAAVGSTISGASKMNDAKETAERAEQMQRRNKEKLDEEYDKTNNLLEELGKKEIEITKNFDGYIEEIKKIAKYKFHEYEKDGVKLPYCNMEELETSSIKATELYSDMVSLGAGVIAGFATYGLTNVITDSIGKNIGGDLAMTAGISVVGETTINAGLAAIGGGALAAGGGIALGSLIVSTGVGALVGGAVFNHQGTKCQEKANDMWHMAKKNETLINDICKKYEELQNYTSSYLNSLDIVNELYNIYLEDMTLLIETNKIWSNYSEEEKLIINNTTLLVQLLYSMCKVNIALKLNDDTFVVNKDGIDDMLHKTDKILMEL